MYGKKITTDPSWIRSVIVMTAVVWTIPGGRSQFSDNTPPTMYLLKRHWVLSSNEPAGSYVAEVHADDNEKDVLDFGIESKYDYPVIPFQIDNTTGIVRTNRSLQDLVGQNMQLYVTVSDGKLTAKSEVYVTITNGSVPRQGSGQIRPPFLPIPSIGHGSFPSNFPPPQPPTNKHKTYLQPVTSPPVSREERPRNATANKDGTETNSVEDEAKTDVPVRSSPELSASVVPVVSVCAIFLAVAVIALVFKNKIYFHRNKHGKDDMRKETSGGMVLQEGWRGRAFSNRYEPWDRDSSFHQGASTDTKDGEILSGNGDRDRWEFPRHRLKVFNILGEGAFGQVWKCEALDIDGVTGVSIVAVKTLKENAAEKERADLQSELQVMKTLEPHANVVRLLGCCTDKEPTFVIMEYVSGGKLQTFLRNSRAERHYGNMHGKSKSLTSRDLTSFVYQVARGMDYLSANGIIHRDLAARNVLITDEHVCKVADFGFARDIVATHVYERKSEGRLPIRWMAPESLYDNIFSVKSDVWSFGVLIWEVVTLGSTPYPGLSAQDVMKKVRDGHRLEKPEHCRRELYNIMYYCWDARPAERPTFAECVQLLEKLLHTETDYIELERFPDHSYYNIVSLSNEKL